MLLEPVDPNERFRSRRRGARRRRAIRRVTALAVVALAAAGATLGARFLGAGEARMAAEKDTRPMEPAAAKPQPRPYPYEMRGIHVTMALASLEGRLAEYLALTREGLNTIELDVKDENGEVAFRSPEAPLASEIGSARDYYDPAEVVREAREHGVYLIGRVVVFEDPFLAEVKPGMAIGHRDGGTWRTTAGLAWANPYDRRVWKYNVDIAVGAVKAGFDEIQFDYIRFPTDGDLSSAVFKGRSRVTRTTVLARFLRYASSRLKPLGARVSADVFGLAATRNMGIGQNPRTLSRYLDAIYPMVYPSHFAPGEYNLPDPNDEPGRTVALALHDFAVALTGRKTRLVPWLQDFSLGRDYTIDDVRAQVQAARDAQSEGFLLWNPAGVYTPGALAEP
jgi:hypothetical protein